MARRASRTRRVSRTRRMSRTRRASRTRKPRVAGLSKKQIAFTEILADAKKALDEAKVPFHLHSGTALGANREHSFIEHDSDIDLGVFRRDYNSKIVPYMLKNGFKLSTNMGTLKWGKEFCFIHTKHDIGLDIFIVYEDTLDGKPINWVASYYGKCNDMKYGFCRWAYRPYTPVHVVLNGIPVMSAPISALEDGYGPNWRVPKKFDYFEGLESGYTNLIKE